MNCRQVTRRIRFPGTNERKTPSPEPIGQLSLTLPSVGFFTQKQGVEVMRFRMGVGLALLVVGTAWAAGLKSGPQVGDSMSPFHPLNVTGKSAGKKNCLV